MRFILILFLFLVFRISGQNQITGNAPDFKGKTITFGSTTDFITNRDAEINSVVVDQNGDFKIDISISEIKTFYLDFGIYRGLLFVEPKTNYQIVLPDFKDKSYEDILNPYFKPEVIYLTVKFPSNSLQNIIKQFDNEYDQLLMEQIIPSMYKRVSRSKTDSLLNILSENYQLNFNPFFVDYLTCKIGFIKYLTYYRSEQTMIREYFAKKPVLYNVPSYGEVFNEVFKNFSSAYLHSEEINRFISTHSFKNFQSYLIGNLNVSEEFSGIVMLKILHDGFVNQSYSTEDLFILLDSVSVYSKFVQQKEIAKNISKKFSTLMKNSNAPEFELYDSDHQLVSLSSLKGKFVYLNFCNLWSTTCIQDFELLKKIDNQHSDLIQVVTISNDQNFDKLIQFAQKNDFNWLFLSYDKQPEVIKNYDVKAFPSYYLIDPYGKFAFSPAPSPRENFDWQFYQLIKKRN